MHPVQDVEPGSYKLSCRWALASSKPLNKLDVEAYSSDRSFEGAKFSILPMDLQPSGRWVLLTIGVLRPRNTCNFRVTMRSTDDTVKQQIKWDFLSLTPCTTV